MTPPASHSNTTLVLRRSFTAPRPRVFRAWIRPEALASWLRPGGERVTVSKLEVRVGGSFRFDLANGNSIVGTYLQIIPPEKLVFTWSGEAIQGQETIVTLDFLEQGPVTEVVLTHERLNTPEMRAIFAGGWPSILDALSADLTDDTPSN